MEASDRRRLLWMAAAVLCSACTLTGLGDYTIETCPHTVGAKLMEHAVGTLSSNPPVTFASLDGATPIAAFAVSGSSPCVEGVAEGAGANATLAPLQQTCTLLASPGLDAQQPMVVQSGSAMAAVAIATGDCGNGQIQVQAITGGGVNNATPPLIKDATKCPLGAALPSIYPLAGKGGQDLVAWYVTSYKNRVSPVQHCPDAQAAALDVGVVTNVTSQPQFAVSKTLTTQSISVGPAAMAPLGSSKVLVASPDNDAVSVWSTSNGTDFGDPVVIKGLAGARAVSIATDGSQRIAVVAEVGCSESIELAVGTLSGGFGAATTVVPKGSTRVVQPSVAWVQSERHWMVGWIQAARGGRALARRFDATGRPVGGVLDPSVGATAATVEADGTLLAYEPGTSGGSLVKRSLGCPP